MFSLTQRLQVLGKAAVGLFSDNSLGELGGFLEGAYTSASVSPVKGNREFLKEYSNMPWLRAVAGKIAYSVASTKWQLFIVTRQERSGRRVIGGPEIKAIQRAEPKLRRKWLLEKKNGGELEEVFANPLLDLLEHGNSLHTGLSVRQLSTLYLDLTGQCFWLKERNRVGAPVAVWPLPPHWIQKIATPSDPFYELQVGAWNKRVPDTEILWMSDPDPYNPYGRGVGQAMSVADELEIDTYASKMAKQIFFNQGKPDFMVSPKQGHITKQDMGRLERYWLDRLQGFWNIAKPIFLPKPVEIKEFTHDFRNFQFTELRKYQRDVVMQVFGIPPEIMGVLANSNRATIDASDYLMASYITVPRLEFQRAQLQERLVPEYDDRLILDYVSPVQEDHEFQLKALQANPATATVDEWRAIQNLKPKKDGTGELHLTEFNKIAVNSLSELRGVSGNGNGLSDLTDEELSVALQLAEKIHGRS